MRLRIVSSTGIPSEITVTGAEAKLGKDPGCEVALDADAYPMVSNLHARIERSGADWLLTHLSRSNKTLVNNQPVEGVVKIQQGDRIRLGYTGPFLEVLSDEFGPASGFALSLDSTAPPAPPPKVTVPAAPPSPLPKATTSKPTLIRTPASIERSKERRVEKPMAGAKGNPIRNLGNLPRGVLWGGVGAAGVIVIVALGFAFTRGKARPEPQSSDRPAKNVPEDTSAPPSNPPVSEPVRKPEKKPAAGLSTMDSLVLALKDGPTPARKKALEELARLGPRARPALAAVLDVLRGPDKDLRSLALETIVRMGPPTKNDLAIYSAALRDPSPEVCIWAAGQLSALGRGAQADLPFLRLLALDTDAAIQEAAMAAVLRIETDWLPSLILGLQDKSVLERCRCAQELALMGVNAKAALPNLVEALADSNSAVRVAAREVFVAIGPDAVMVLGEGLRDKNMDVRLSAIYALGRMGPDARFVLPELIAVAYDLDALAREEALAAMARIGEYSIPYVLQGLEREQNLARQKTLLDALERIGHNAGPAVHKSLQHAKPHVAKVTAPLMQKLSLQPAPKSRVAHTGQVLVIQKQLLAWFVVVDINSDGFLDKQELAYAFRGPNALPYDYNPNSKIPRIFGTSDFVLFPDFAFLSRLDRNNDGLISFGEFEYWAYDFAEFTKKDADERDRIMKARARAMEHGITEAVRKQREFAAAEAWANHQKALRAQHHTPHMENVVHTALKQKSQPKRK